MALKNLFDMVKADKYTADGREAIIKAQEAETEDKVYQIGEISQKTGLQKTANGWVKPKSGKPAEDPKTGVPTQGSDWMSLPSGTRMTFEGAKEKMAKNNERIETIKKMMEGKSRADNFRLGSELKTLQNENEYIAERLPPEKTESPSASGAAPSTPQSTIIGKLSSEDKNKIYQLFNDADFKRQLDSRLEFGLDDKVGEMILKKMPHGALQSKIYDLSRDYNRENFKDARDYKSGLAEAAMGQLYKDYKKSQASDSAPRILTGDTRIRVRKA